MTTDVEGILEAIRALPPSRQFEVLHSLARSLGQSWPPLAKDEANFWSRRSVDELAAEQGVSVANDLAAFAMADWPADEAPEDLNTYTRAQRDADHTV